MKINLDDFKLTKSETQKITGGNCIGTYRRTYVGDDWWKDDPDTCPENEQ